DHDPAHTETGTELLLFPGYRLALGHLTSPPAPPGGAKIPSSSPRTRMSRRTLAHLALFIVNLIYGVNYVVAKGLMPEVIQPGAFILLRVVGGAILFWIMRAFLSQKVEPQDLKRLFLCALFGVAINQMMFFEGLMRTSPVNSSIIMVAT